MDSTHSALAGLPIWAQVPALARALEADRRVLLQAPPGSGKTTALPLALLQSSWLQGRRILVLQPRRLAAKAAARRAAHLLGEAVGETVGYQVRHERRIGPRTRIQFLTEGLLTGRLQDDPALQDVGLLIFDEFHERSIHADLALALALEAQEAFREDLRVLLMSATLDRAGAQSLLGPAPVLEGGARQYPVETRYRRPAPGEPPERAVTGLIRELLREPGGGLLCFLPGEGEIRRVAQWLSRQPLPQGVILAPLYGALAPAAQDRALAPAPAGRRKVVLASAVAETSLTVAGIDTVVDSGLSRLPRFDPRSGMTRLETVRVSRAAADQRRGRAGREGRGTCWRLWAEAEDRALAPAHPAEILTADLAPLALELAVWGARDAAALRWIDPPPAGAFEQARDLLRQLDAVDGQDAATEHGRRLATLGVHPRLGHMLLSAPQGQERLLACDIAALLEERDPLAGNEDRDIHARLLLLQSRRVPGAAEAARLATVRRTAAALRRRLKLPAGRSAESTVDRAGALLARAYPDRIARLRPGQPGRFLLRNGRGAAVPAEDPLAAQPWLAVGTLAGGGPAEARIRLAAPLRVEEVEEAFAGQIAWHREIRWDPAEEAVIARRERRLGAIAISRQPLPEPDPAETARAMLDGIRQMGLDCLPWTARHRNWLARVRFVATLEGHAGRWPDASEAALARTLEDWLLPFLGGITRKEHLPRLPLGEALDALLDWLQRQALDAAAPESVHIPSGQRRAIDYAGASPTLRVRLQEMFGTEQTPRIANGRVPLTLELLSPAGRPLQVTRDLAHFWRHGYEEVRREMRGRYPKHPWPEDPLAAQPTASTKRRSARK